MVEEPDFYDPRLSALVAQCVTDWGDPVKNRENLIPYGIKYIDQELYGLDPSGELIVIQGEEKKRKTTLWINIIINIMMNPNVKTKPVVNVDMLESGMPVKKLRDTILANIATRYILRQGHRADAFCPECGTEKCRHLDLSHKFMRYRTRTPVQQEAINYAIDETSNFNNWPILIHGARLDQGNTRDLRYAAVSGPDGQHSRWRRLVENLGVKIMVEDHVQQYIADETDEYKLQLHAVRVISSFVAQYGIANFLVSQVSLTSLRDVKQNGGKLVAAGGSKAAQEANTVFRAEYNNDGAMKIKIELSRDAGNLTVRQPLDDSSGAFYGEATLDMMD